MELRLRGDLVDDLVAGTDEDSAYARAQAIAYDLHRPHAVVVVQGRGRATGEPLTRAELGTLLAYAKIVLFSDILATDVPDDPHFERDLMAYFPDRMEKKYAAGINGHRLRREIITRVLANDLINRGGPAFVTRLQDETGRGARRRARLPPW